MSENLNAIGEAVDRIDNLIAALKLPLPLQMHIDQIKQSLPEISEAIKKAVVAETGENPWE